MNVDIHFCGNFGRVLCRNADDILDLLLDARRVCRRQVDLVDNRHDLQTGVNGKIGVAERLRLNTLCRINNQKRTLTRRQRTRNLIVEVHMSRGVDQVHFVGLAVVRGIFHADSARLDGNAALALKLHIVE